MAAIQPMTQEQVLAAYETLRECSNRMLEWARLEDWDSLVNEESRYIIEVERLSKLEPSLAMDVAQQERKAELLEQILEQDMEIRRRLVERRDALSELIGVSQRKRDLNRAYRPLGKVSHLPKGRT
ncbi:hypothetical protein GCM10007160_04530 [Litchfieldella qijiaojingensis]|uniref:Flagellar protein FliT n=1 Tax=Litchfieldella qijiaojingensis TaxID=980347 RepID=A0ABQ2YDQ0_9GAMM|nr:flagellar protein FliT [Halomonas qijiaojingensis]GGX80140.1 hypothetical protein GCM10007160_04530 [Halomonas qijiaojingensis]